VHLSRLVSELSRHCGRDINHLNTIGVNTDGFQEGFQVSQAAFCVDITFQVMTITLESTCHQDAISSLFEGFQKSQNIYSTCAGQFNNFDCWRILHSKPTG